MDFKTIKHAISISLIGLSLTNDYVYISNLFLYNFPFAPLAFIFHAIFERP